MGFLSGTDTRGWPRGFYLRFIIRSLSHCLVASNWSSRWLGWKIQRQKFYRNTAVHLDDLGGEWRAFQTPVGLVLRILRV